MVRALISPFERIFGSEQGRRVIQIIAASFTEIDKYNGIIEQRREIRNNSTWDVCPLAFDGCSEAKEAESFYEKCSWPEGYANCLLQEILILRERLKEREITA